MNIALGLTRVKYFLHEPDAATPVIWRGLGHGTGKGGDVYEAFVLAILFGAISIA
jgi:hypothetical protein